MLATHHRAFSVVYPQNCGENVICLEQNTRDSRTHQFFLLERTSMTGHSALSSQATPSGFLMRMTIEIQGTCFIVLRGLQQINERSEFVQLFNMRFTR